MCSSTSASRSLRSPAAQASKKRRTVVASSARTVCWVVMAVTDISWLLVVAHRDNTAAPREITRARQVCAKPNAGVRMSATDGARSAQLGVQDQAVVGVVDRDPAEAAEDVGAEQSQRPMAARAGQPERRE